MEEKKIYKRESDIYMRNSEYGQDSETNKQELFCHVVLPFLDLSFAASNKGWLFRNAAADVVVVFHPGISVVVHIFVVHIFVVLVTAMAFGPPSRRISDVPVFVNPADGRITDILDGCPPSAEFAGTVNQRNHRRAPVRMEGVFYKRFRGFSPRTTTIVIVQASFCHQSCRKSSFSINSLVRLYQYKYDELRKGEGSPIVSRADLRLHRRQGHEEAYQ
jgi:hypothetical protein